MGNKGKEDDAPLYMGDVLKALSVVSDVGLSNAGPELFNLIKRLDFYEEQTGMFFTVTWEGPVTPEEATKRGQKFHEVLPVANYPRHPPGWEES